jgi:hypothetical protein
MFWSATLTCANVLLLVVMVWSVLLSLCSLQKHPRICDDWHYLGDDSTR